VADLRHSDFLMDGGVTASYRFGELAPLVINYTREALSVFQFQHRNRAW
jgi:hypothetical protein